MNKNDIMKILIESAITYENKYRVDEGYKKGGLKRGVQQALRGGANPEKVKKEGLAGEEVREKGAKFRGKGAAKGFDKKMKKSHLPPKDAKLMRQGLKMEQTEIEEAKFEQGKTPVEKKVIRAKRFKEDPERILIRTDGTPARKTSHKMLRGLKKPSRMNRKVLRDEMPDEKDMRPPYK